MRETSEPDTQQQALYNEKVVAAFSNLNSFLGLLEALFVLGNTLELIYLGGIIFPSNTAGERPANSLIPLYVDIRAKKCHYCMKPIVDYSQGLYCSNILQGLTNLEQACYKFMCRDCLGSEW